MNDRKIFNLQGNDHYKLLEIAFLKVNPKYVYYIMDAGSGKTSLGSLMTFFTAAQIDAYVYPNDINKIDSITKEIISNRYSLIEQDICNDRVAKKYNLVLAHLILGESYKYGHSSNEMLNTLLDINFEYLLICDYVDDENINLTYLVEMLRSNPKLELVYVEDKKRENKFMFDDMNRENLFICLIKKLKR